LPADHRAAKVVPAESLVRTSGSVIDPRRRRPRRQKERRQENRDERASKKTGAVKIIHLADINSATGSDISAPRS